MEPSEEPQANIPGVRSEFLSRPAPAEPVGAAAGGPAEVSTECLGLWVPTGCRGTRELCIRNHLEGQKSCNDAVDNSCLVLPPANLTVASIQWSTPRSQPGPSGMAVPLSGFLPAPQPPTCVCPVTANVAQPCRMLRPEALSPCRLHGPGRA